MPRVEERKIYRCNCNDCARMYRCNNLYLSYSGAYSKERRCPMRLSNKCCATCKHYDDHHLIKYTNGQMEQIDVGLYCKKQQKELHYPEFKCEYWEKGKRFWEVSDEDLRKYAESLDEE